MTPQPKEQSHSALPWSIAKHEPTALTGYATAFGTSKTYPLFIDSKHFRVAAILGDGSENKGLSAANAEFILIACNSHARLLAQNEMLSNALRAIEGSDTGFKAKAIARAALEQT